MRERIRSLTEDTRISIGLVAIILGGVAFFTTMYVKGETTADAVTRVEDKQDKFNRMFLTIDGRLSRIEGMLDGKRR